MPAAHLPALGVLPDIEDHRDLAKRPSSQMPYVPSSWQQHTPPHTRYGSTRTPPPYAHILL